MADIAWILFGAVLFAGYRYGWIKQGREEGSE